MKMFSPERVGRPMLSKPVKGTNYASPTGNPVIPPWLVPWLVAAGAICAALVAILPPHTLGFKIAAAIESVLVVFGLASPGLRGNNVQTVNDRLDSIENEIKGKEK
jgi:hypothetical protein